MLSLTFKNLWARKWRSLMTAVAVIFGIALVAGTYILTDTTNQAFDQIFNESLAGTDVVVTAKSEVDQQDGSTPAFPAKILKKVDQVDGVKVAAGSIFTQGAILDDQGDSIGAGFSPQFIASTGPKVFEAVTYPEGHPPTNAHEATLDQAAADRKGIELGDTIELVGTDKAVPFRVVGLTQLGGASFGGSSIAQVQLPVAQRVTGKVGEYDQISIAADSGISSEELRDRVSEVVPKNLRVETAQENADRNASEIRDSLQFLTIALLAFAAIALFVGSFVIFNVFSITVAQRTREFGMLRTLGASRGQILRTVVIEGLIIGLVGSLLGLVVGYGLAAGLSAVLKAVGAELGLVVATYGHAGDGNLHTNVLYAGPQERPRVEQALERIMRITVELGGTITGEHGVGLAKKRFLSLEQSASVIDLQRRLKVFFDPEVLLNPGKMFP